MRVDYGAVALIPRGDFNSATQYKVNDVVSYNGSSFVVKTQPPIGTLPTNAAYFSVMASGASPATSQTVGTVKPDNTSTTVANDGTLSVGKNITDALTVNLNNSTKATQTATGVTITKNGDGTYTVNGTATGDSYVPFSSDYTLKAGKYKLVGCPSGGTSTTYNLRVISAQTIAYEYGNGANFTLSEDTKLHVSIAIKQNTVCDNLVFKPMITTNLNATYDDFVQYTGSSGKLGDDYKALNDKVATVQGDVTSLTTSLASTETKAETNRVNIASLNSAMENKIGTHTDSGAHGIREIAYNTSTGIVVAQDDVTDEWYSLSDKLDFYGNVITPLVSGFTMTFHGLYVVGRLRILIAHIVLAQNYASETVVAKINTTAPNFLAECTCRDNQGHFATFRLDTDKNIMVWGQAQATNGGVYLCQFTYFA